MVTIITFAVYVNIPVHVLPLVKYIGVEVNRSCIRLGVMPVDIVCMFLCSTLHDLIID